MNIHQIRGLIFEYLKNGTLLRKKHVLTKISKRLYFLEF